MRQPRKSYKLQLVIDRLQTMNDPTHGSVTSLFVTNQTRNQILVPKTTGEGILLGKISITLICMSCVLPRAHAETDRRNELGILLGATVTPEVQTLAPNAGTLQIGPGITFQLDYARELKKSQTLGLYLEVPALAIPLQNVTTNLGTAPRNYDSFFGTPGIRVKLAPHARVSPWFSAGGGYALFDESALRTNSTHNTTRGTSGGAVQFGGGIDFKTPINSLFPINLRVEARDFYTSKPAYNLNTGDGLQHNVVLSGGVVLRF